MMFSMESRVRTVLFIRATLSRISLVRPERFFIEQSRPVVMFFSLASMSWRSASRRRTAESSKRSRSVSERVLSFL